MIINIIMFDLSKFAIQELPAGRAFFKKGEFYYHLYYLEEGKARVIINQITIEVSSPIFIGDYEILAEIQYRTSMIKSLTKCKIRAIPIEQYAKLDHHDYQQIEESLRQFNLKQKVLRYWLKKLFFVSHYNKNEAVYCENSIGIVLQGQFKHASSIPLVNMKERKFNLLRKFEISIIGKNELFQEDIICESSRGKVGIIPQKYISQLSSDFQEFAGIINICKFKKKMHINLTNEIAYNCRKKRNLFQNMIPITLKNSIQPQSPRHEAKQNEVIQERKHRYDIKKLVQTNQVYTVKDNLAQFLHRQWRKGLSLSLPRKSNQATKLDNVTPLRNQKLQSFRSPQMIKLTIPHQLQQNKFNFKMLLKSKINSSMKSKRIKTQPQQEYLRPKLFFQD